MSNQNAIDLLILTGKRVFTTDDLAVLWQVPYRSKLIGRIKHYLRTGRLQSVHKGVYAYGRDYSPLEVAQKLVPLSYLSLYTTAQLHGLLFQYYGAIYSIALVSKRYVIDDQEYVYHRVKKSIFYNSIGLVMQDGRTIAGPERTICDLLYVYPKISFEYLNNLKLDTTLLTEISGIYGNKRLERDIQRLIYETRSA